MKEKEERASTIQRLIIEKIKTLKMSSNIPQDNSDRNTSQREVVISTQNCKFQSL